MLKRFNVLLLGIFAGAAIAFGGILFMLANTIIPNDSWISPTLVGALLFPVGLLLVCYLRLNLYTGKIGIAFRNKKIDKKGLNVFEWLFLILLGNAIGAFTIGLIVYSFTLIDQTSKFALMVYSVGQSRNMVFDFDGVFNMIFKSILCGMLVYIAIYFFGKMKDNFGKVIGVVTPIAFFVYAGFQHCIANMFYIAAGNVWSIDSLIGLLICIVGNSLGALFLDLFVKYK